MTLLRDLIGIPQFVRTGDYVFKLADAVDEPQAVLKDYVVTEQLVFAYDRALKLVQGALQKGASEGTYLHGSFGSGKSHFMAVLYLLLAQNAAVRAREELAQTVADHDVWLEGRKFLLVPYHMIGQRSMEGAVLGGYADRIRSLHPEAPVPAVYLGQPVLADAERMRSQIGDEPFFAMLNEGATQIASGWGSYAQGWDAASYARAADDGGSAEYNRLIGDLVGNVFRSVQGVAGGGGAAFVPFAAGLSVMSQHARDLGYDAIILFLDELVLWLASKISDTTFVSDEGSKLAQLVEAARADRPIPIVSFIARQRDLRELIGDSVPGAERLVMDDTLRWWEGRFDTITLEDRNLMAIAEKRVLAPNDSEAKATIDNAFAETQRTRQEVLDTLLGQDGDVGQFRAVYPFSPAFVQTLVAASSLLQRERTAIKVMVQLLVDRRDELEVGDVIPLGDLYDVLAAGDEPFTEEMRAHFEAAKRLYAQKLRPALREVHNLTEEQGEAAAPGSGFRTDDRLVKTLLLSALVPGAAPLRDLTVSRLAALNHGTIKSPIPGQERTFALARIQKLSAQIGEIKLSGDDQNPTVSLQLTGVDTDSIIERAREFDTPGERRRKLRELLFQAIGITGDESLLSFEYTWSWRGTSRTADVVFANVREAGDDVLRSSGDRWKVVLDFPWDAPGTGPSDDEARVEQFLDQYAGGTRTICWIPAFFTTDLQRDVGVLVILDSLFAGERFEQRSAHLSVPERAEAKALLDNRRTQLRQRIVIALEQAYGIARATDDTIDAALRPERHVVVLEPGFDLRQPVGATLADAFEDLLGRLLEHQYPGHPAFGQQVRVNDLRKTYEVVDAAYQTPNMRADVDRPLRRTMKAVAEPLGLGTMYEAHFVASTDWHDRFLQRLAAEGGELTVARLRGWMDEPQPRGLTAEVGNLVILLFAERTSRRFTLNGGPYPTTRLERLPDDLVLVEQPLPVDDAWREARSRAALLLGIQVGATKTAANVSALQAQAQEAARAKLPAVVELVVKLEGTLVPAIDLDAGCDRLAAARNARSVLEALTSAAADGVVDALEQTALDYDGNVVMRTIANAGEVVRAIDGVQWRLLEGVSARAQGGSERAKQILAELREAAEHHQLSVDLAVALERAQRASAELLAAIKPPPTPPVNANVVASGEDVGLDAGGVQELVDTWISTIEESGGRLTVTWRIEKP